MLSKISFGLAPNKSACIKVDHLPSGDVRDEIAQMLTEELDHRSTTFQLCELNQKSTSIGLQSSYILLPVKDEIKYMLGRCMDYIYPLDGDMSFNKITEFFTWMEYRISRDFILKENDPLKKYKKEGTQLLEIDEKKIVEEFKSMCEQSLPPDQFEALEVIIHTLNTTRKALKQ